MNSYLIKNREDEVYDIYDDSDSDLFIIKLVGNRSNSQLLLLDKDSEKLILSFNGSTDATFRFTYSVKNEDNVEVFKIAKDQFTLCLNIHGIFGDLKVRRIKSDSREFNITKDGAIVGRMIELKYRKSSHLKLEVYDEFFTIVLLGIYIITDIGRYYGEY